MKKFITLIAAAAMLAVSCNKENGINGGSTPGVLTATFEQTKVSYTENGNNLQPAWEVDDKIVGFDEAGETYTFTVTDVKSTTATLSADKTIADGAYHLIFKAGAQASDISDKSLAVSYDGQSGDKTMPAVMLADGTVTDGGCNFTFSNAGAIVGISAVKGVPANSEISKITVEGENLSGATVALDGSALKLTATTKTGDAISTAALSGITADAQGQLSGIVYVAVPAGATIAKVSATVGSDTYTYTLTAAKTSNANDYLYVKTQQFKKDVVLPEGALPGVFSVSATKKVYFSKGNLWYGKVGSASAATFQFEAEQYEYHTYDFTNNTWGLFGWVGASSQAFTSSPEIYGVSTSLTIDDYGNVSDEALKADWGKAIDNNDTWRTLFLPEWEYLFNTRTDAVSKFGFATVGGFKGIIILPDTFTDPMKNNGSAAFAPKSTTTGWTANVYTTGGNWEAMEAAGAVFLPAASRRKGSDLSNTDGYGYYWSSTSLYSQQKPNSAYFMNFYSTGINPENYGSRNYGYSVRLVTDAN